MLEKVLPDVPFRNFTTPIYNVCTTDGASFPTAPSCPYPGRKARTPRPSTGLALRSHLAVHPKRSSIPSSPKLRRQYSSIPGKRHDSLASEHGRSHARPRQPLARWQGAQPHPGQHPAPSARWHCQRPRGPGRPRPAPASSALLALRNFLGMVFHARRYYR